MVPWLRRSTIPWFVLAMTLGVVISLTAYLSVAGEIAPLRGANMAFANLAVCALALATLWPHSVPNYKSIGQHALTFVTGVAHQFLFVGYFCALSHYVCSFALLADADYLRFAKAHPVGVIVAILGSLFVTVLSIQCLSADGKVKAFAIKINGVILGVFVVHLALLNYEDVVAAGSGHLRADSKVAIASFLICSICLGFYGRALLARFRRSRAAPRPPAIEMQS
jgi:hypothetical protein